MFHLNEYNEINRRFNTYLFREDDKDVQAKCFGQIHQFAPGSAGCVCGKYPNYNDVLTAVKAEEDEGKKLKERNEVKSELNKKEEVEKHSNIYLGETQKESEKTKPDSSIFAPNNPSKK